VHYVMLICGDESWQDQPPEQLEAFMKEVFAWFEQQQAAGTIAHGGEQLQPTKTAKTIRPDGSGSTLVTDGPFVEAKEALGGFVVLEADSLQQAVEIASSWPGAAYPGTAIEVRPVVSYG
jgi:hypothetical protein